MDHAQPDTTPRFFFRLGWLNGTLSVVWGVVSRRKADIRAISVFSDFIKVELRSRDAVQMPFSEIENVSLIKSWLVYNLAIVEKNGNRYRAISFRRHKLHAVQQSVISHVQLFEVRKNRDELVDTYTKFINMVNNFGYISDSHLRRFLTGNPIPALPDISLISDELLTGYEREVLKTLSRPREFLNQNNEQYVELNMEKWGDFLNTVESNPLTEQQKLAVLHNEDNTLVLAGAGTGKTSTIVAKVGYLLKSGLAQPQDILLLSFTRDSAQEMKERIAKRLGADVEVNTFHSFGLGIINSVEQKKPSVSKVQTASLGFSDLCEASAIGCIENVQKMLIEIFLV